MVNKLDRSREGKSAQVTFRAGQKLLTALDAEVNRLRAERLGGRVQRSDVVREILGRTLLGGHAPAEGEGIGGEIPTRSIVVAAPDASPTCNDSSPLESTQDARSAMSPASTTRTKPAVAAEAGERQGGRASNTSPKRTSRPARQAPPDLDTADEDDDEEANVAELTRRFGRVPRDHPLAVHRSKVLREYYLEARNKLGIERAEIARETGIPADVLDTFGEKKPLSDKHRDTLVH